MDHQAASRVGDLLDPGPGSSEELARLMRVIDLVGPESTWAAARALYDCVVFLDGTLARDPDYPRDRTDAWAEQQRDRNARLEAFRGAAVATSRGRHGAMPSRLRGHRDGRTVR